MSDNDKLCAVCCCLMTGCCRSRFRGWRLTTRLKTLIEFCRKPQSLTKSDCQSHSFDADRCMSVWYTAPTKRYVIRFVQWSVIVIWWYLVCAVVAVFKVVQFNQQQNVGTVLRLLEMTESCCVCFSFTACMLFCAFLIVFLYCKCVDNHSTVVPWPVH